MFYILLGICFVLFLRIAWNYGNHAKNILSKMSIKIVPNALPFFGHGLELIKSKHFGQYDIDNTMKYGNIYGVCELHTPVVVVKDLKILKDILIKQFNCFTDRRELLLRGWMKESLVDQKGEKWKNTRTILTPFFSTHKLKNCLPAIQSCSKSFISNINNMILKDSNVDITQITSAFTLDIICSTAFGVEVDSHNDKDSENQLLMVLTKIQNLDMGKFSILLTYTLPFFNPIFEFFGITMFPSGYLNYFEKVAKQLIAQRKLDTKKHEDFLNVLIKAEESQNSGLDNKGMSQKEIQAQMLLFFFAGYDTTAKTLTMLLYLLALHPDIQDQLLYEINENLENKEPDYENINKVEYLEAIISETLRLYPALYRFDRTATCDVKLEDGIEIKKGVVVAIPAWAIHHDPEIWPEPESFNPDRFSAENRKLHDVCSFLPFGLGGRSCIGIRFAHLVLKILLVHFLRKYKLSVCDKTEIPIKLVSGGIFVQPLNNVFLKVETRTY